MGARPEVLDIIQGDCTNGGKGDQYLRWAAARVWLALQREWVQGEGSCNSSTAGKWLWGLRICVPGT